MRSSVGTSQVMRWAAAFLLMAAPMSGCAHRAAITSWKPAEIEVTSMQKLAVLGFSGEHGDRVASAVKSRLWDCEFYTIVDHRELESIRRVSGISAGRSLLSLEELEAARTAEIDGLLTGDVIEYRCEDRTCPESNSPWKRLSKTAASDQTGTQGTPGDDGDGLLVREATVTIAFRLLDTKTGSIRASRQVTRSMTTSAADRPYNAPTPTAESLLRELTGKCVDEFVATLAPRQVQEQVKLALPPPFQAGFTLVHNGNEFAVRGRWDEAIVAWERAVEVNPENDAALFNLSLAHAGRQQFNRAESYAIRALNVRQKPEYQAGLDRIREQVAAYDQTLQQRRDVTIPDLSDDAFHWKYADRRRD